MCHSIAAVIYQKLTDKEDLIFQKGCRKKIIGIVGKKKLAIHFYHKDAPFDQKKVFNGKQVDIVIFIGVINPEEIKDKILQTHTIGNFHTWDSFKESNAS